MLPAAGWSAGGPMMADRAWHTATVLPNNRVLVAGGAGFNGSGAVYPYAGYQWYASAEVYDAAANTWTRTGALAGPRIEHRAVALANGRVMVIGGIACGTSGFDNCEIYDPASCTWSVTATLPSAGYANAGPYWYGHTATVLANGQVLMAAGVWAAADLPGGQTLSVGGGSGTTEAWVYTPSTATWVQTGALLAARKNHGAIRLGNGQVLVVGGDTAASGVPATPSGNRLTSCELYNPATGTWANTTALTTAVNRVQLAAVAGGRVLSAGLTVTGGPAVELYDPSTGTWSAVAAPPNVAVGGQALAAVSGGRAALFGSSAVDVYDPTTNTWSSAGSMSPHRLDESVTPMAGNAWLLIAGGRVDGAGGSGPPSTWQGFAFTPAALRDRP